MKKYKWLSETIIGTILCAVILTGVSFVSDTTTEQIIQDKDIESNTEDIEYLQKTANATHNQVTDISYELDDKADKEDLNDLKDEIKNLIIWLNMENNKRLTDNDVIDPLHENILGAENVPIETEIKNHIWIDTIGNLFNDEAKNRAYFDKGFYPKIEFNNNIDNAKFY